MSDARTFLQALFNHKPSDSWLLIWTLPEKHSSWFTDISQAVQAVESMPGKDVYVGVALSPKNYGRNRRCRAEDTAGIVGLWADIDIRGPAHQKENLPPTQLHAQTLLSSMGAEPSIVVHSGNGLQAWWLFREPWMFEDDEERQEAARLATAWTRTLRLRARAQGWDVDATMDLARVLRVPGTMNTKVEPRPVKIIKSERIRYNPSDLEAFLLDEALAQEYEATPAQVVRGHDLTLDPDASPPFDKFQALASIEPKFLQTWERRRRDLHDDTPSAYDMSLATHAAMAGWEPQEIADLIVAGRRKHGEDLKLRPDYYAMTISKAKAFVEKLHAQEAIDEIVVTQEPPATEDEAEARRQAIMQNLSALFGVQITRIVKYMSDPPQYRLETAHGAVMLGGSATLLRHSAFQAKVMDATGHVIPPFKGERWRSIVQAMNDCMVQEDIGQEATDAGLAHSWLIGYLREREPIDDANDAATTEQPFQREDKIYIFGADFRRWLSVAQGERVSAKAMGALLRAYGAEPETISIKLGDKYTTRGVWGIPGERL